MDQSPDTSAYQYRLRAGQPMPIIDGTFVIHTFRAEKSTIDMYLYTQELPLSSDFRGQGGTYLSASFSRLNDKCGDSFQGKVVSALEYIDEDGLGFNL
jgi:hypothetical protein